MGWCKPGWALALFAAVVSAPAVSAQGWDLPSVLGEIVSAQTEGKLKFGFEQRVRWESKTGNSFGKDPDADYALARTRVSLTYQPFKTLRFSAMMQDSRSPWYGANASSSLRDPADLHEAYMEIAPAGKTGFGMSVGRRMLNYGEGRLIGTPQWSNTSRTYDHARVSWVTPRARFEVLMASQVKVLIGDFNKPALGDRLWGTYDAFPNLWKKNLLEVYLLRRDQNRTAGFTGGSKAAGTDRLGLNTLGFRLAGPLAAGIKYSVEGALQNGMVGPAHHRASAWFSNLSRRWMAGGKPLDASGEYKFASGSRNPGDTSLSRTFDQLYAANHDRFGHQDLFGWRNIHNLRSLETFGLTKSLAVNFMYGNFWLASARDSLYNGSGKSLARSANGSAGTHVGQETDVFCTYKYRRLQFGAGYGYLFPGTFLKKTTPGVAPSYAYVFHNYTL